jgi:NTP pyrophosphatase (non-canonical NTP hydrolase)
MMFDTQDIATLDAWYDRQVSAEYKRQPLAQDWARISKISEELGEVTDAFIGVTAQNPRKGEYGSMCDVHNELADVAITALLALQHFTQSEAATTRIIVDRMRYRMLCIGTPKCS